MHLLYTDETNLDPDSTDFFVYAGVSIEGSQAASLSADISRLRQQFKYKPTDLLKFNTRERPEQITPETHAAIKRAVMETAAKHEVRLFASMILHDLATSPDVARRFEISRVCYHFDS